MNLDELIKYLMWIVFFVIAAVAIITTLKKVGIV